MIVFVCWVCVFGFAFDLCCLLSVGVGFDVFVVVACELCFGSAVFVSLIVYCFGFVCLLCLIVLILYFLWFDFVLLV